MNKLMGNFFSTSQENMGELASALEHEGYTIAWDNPQSAAIIKEVSNSEPENPNT